MKSQENKIFVNDIYKVTLKEWLETKEEFYQFFNKESKYIILGENNKDYKDMYTISFKNSINLKMNIGIFSERHGIKPSILLKESENKIYVAYDNKIVIIDIETTRIIKEIDAMFIVYELLDIKKLDKIIIITEIGIQCIDLQR